MPRKAPEPLHTLSVLIQNAPRVMMWVAFVTVLFVFIGSAIVSMFN